MPLSSMFNKKVFMQRNKSVFLRSYKPRAKGSFTHVAKHKHNEHKYIERRASPAGPSVPTRGCCYTTSGAAALFPTHTEGGHGERAHCCGAPRSPVVSHPTVGKVWSVELDAENHHQGLQASVRINAPQFQWRAAFTTTGEGGSNPTGGNRGSQRERGHSSSATRAKPGGLLFEILPCPKEGRGVAPILDLRALNKYMRTYKFRMLTHTTLVRFVRQGDWFVSIDPKDAYFHIPIYPPHRKYLRFAFQGVVYEYTVLPFGLSLSPRAFVKCTEAAVAPLRKKGLRLATYIDDWLLAAQCPQQIQAHTRLLLSHLASLGFTVNWDKSVLVPSQSVEFIGLHLNSVTCKARLSADRIKAISACLATFRRGALLHYRTCLRLLGLMASALVVVPLGRLHMRPFQRWVAALCLNPSRHRHRRVLVTAECVRALRPWRCDTFLTVGVAMGTVTARKVITTDASLWGWGATHEGKTVRGIWSSQMRLCHINYLELQAVWLALQHFLPLIRGQHVLVRTDNTTVVAYVNKQGGLRSHQLHTLAHRLIVWACSHLLSLRATHIPGVLNRGADLLSRGSPRYRDWKLNSGVVSQIWNNYGEAEVDLFASREDAQCHLYYSLTDQSAPLGLDALAHEWPRVLLYAFPPLELITLTLSRVREKKHSLILVAPYWPAMHWMAEIFQLLCGRPWPLPLRSDLVTQARGEIFHPYPERLALWAWPVRG